ncbi:aldose epimerase family protein [uncultured Roseobacter sp.]|uniref:aldose epimerase family protein n=1 Tax=uncultured Roseobacter sp. TaxID=114847 RepID=UPI0026057D29|nr:aldose epimerase family protein [uncultured Roseobacter sp.]
MQTEIIGSHDGHDVEALKLVNGRFEAHFLTYGARLTALWVPDAHGEQADVVLGFDDLQSYVEDKTYMGAICGQYANRIAGGHCLIDDQKVQLDRNEGRNHLHGGSVGLDRKVWQIASLEMQSVQFSTITEDGEMGFPGRSRIFVRYTLTDNGALEIEMTADTDKPTLMNLANHAYFNLSGQGSGDVLDHRLQIAAQAYTPVDGDGLATGEVRDVTGTRFDFREARPIRQVDAAVDLQRDDAGYDHNWCLERSEAAVTLLDPRSGRRMQISTTKPGVQVYTGGHLGERMIGKTGRRLCRFAGVALETQAFPCSPNFAHFPNTVLRPGEPYQHKTRLQFGAIPYASSVPDVGGSRKRSGARQSANRRAQPSAGSSSLR